MHKTITIYIFLFLAFPISNFAQGWAPVGSYTWNSSGGVNNLTSDTNYLYASGSFVSIGTDTMNNIARWNGTIWSSLGNGMKFGAGTLCTNNGMLYAVGAISSGGNPFVLKWNGSNWSQLGASFNNSIATLHFYNGELYAGGDFDSVGMVVAHKIAKWNGSIWLAVGSGMNNNIVSLASFKGNLYASGGFTLADGNPASYIAKWNGSNWLPLGSGVNQGGLSLAANNNFLFIGGSGLTNAGGVSVNGIAQWDGSNWFNLPAGMANITSLYADTISNNLYAGVMLYHSVYRWDGSNWYSLCTPGTILVSNIFSSPALFKGVIFANQSASGSNTPVSMCSNPYGGALGIITNYNKDFTISPYPLIEKSILDFGEDVACHIIFYDVLGRKVNEKEFTRDLTLDRRDFGKDGMYFYHITSNNKTYIGKLLVL